MTVQNQQIVGLPDGEMHRHTSVWDHPESRKVGHRYWGGNKKFFTFAIPFKVLGTSKMYCICPNSRKSNFRIQHKIQL